MYPQGNQSNPFKTLFYVPSIKYYFPSGQIAKRANVNLDSVKNVVIWGNHSSTQYPDVNHGVIDGKSVKDVLSGDANWLKTDFISTIQKRGAAIINARKASSALSAARAITGERDAANNMSNREKGLGCL
jgi:malate/lactate dehydrogenase